MSEESTILSVGIDIGTSTTQVIFSRLTFKNSAGYFAVPHIAIVDKEVVSKSFPRYWEALAGCFGTKSGYSDS